MNCFTYRKVRGFPSEVQSFTVLAFLTDGLGEIELEVVLQDLDNMEELYRVGRRVIFNSPLNEYRFLFRFRDISFPTEGAYEIMLMADNELVTARKIRIEQRGDR